MQTKDTTSPSDNRRRQTVGEIVRFGIVGIIAPARMDYADVCAKLIAFTQAVSGVTGNGMKRLKDAGESDDRRNESADRSAK